MVSRPNLTTETASYEIPLGSWGVASSLALLPTSPDATSLGRTSGTHGTNTPLLVGTTTNGGATASASETGRALFQMPPEYVSGGTVTIRVHARVSATRNTSASVDVAAFEGDGEGGVSADLVTTAATSVNASNAWADRDFAVSSSALEPGSLLDILITGASNDTGGSGNGAIQIGKVSVVCQIRG